MLEKTIGEKKGGRGLVQKSGFWPRLDVSNPFSRVEEEFPRLLLLLIPFNKIFFFGLL